MGIRLALTSRRSRAASWRRSALTDTHSTRRPPSAQCCLIRPPIWRPLPTPAPAGGARGKPALPPLSVPVRWRRLQVERGSQRGAAQRSIAAVVARQGTARTVAQEEAGALAVGQAGPVELHVGVHLAERGRGEGAQAQAQASGPGLRIRLRIRASKDGTARSDMHRAAPGTPLPATLAAAPRTAHNRLQLRVAQQPLRHAVVQAVLEGGGGQRHRGQRGSLHQSICGEDN